MRPPTDILLNGQPRNSGSDTSSAIASNSARITKLNLPETGDDHRAVFVAITFIEAR